MYSIINLKSFGDFSGSLVAIENGSQIPFQINRVFFIYGTKTDVVRGCHANRKSQFVLISVKGSCKVKIKTPNAIEEVDLDSPTKGLWLDKMVWKEMYAFSSDAVLLVLSSEMYDKNEYISNYNEYLEELKKC
jgi:dTDP-4-dehydrorhamnose 3,5-epimerase-like enzyme